MSIGLHCTIKDGSEFVGQQLRGRLVGALFEAETMKSNWSNAARRMTKYQFGLMLALVGSTAIMSPAQADLDEKSKVISEWLVNFTIKTLPDLTTAPQRITMPTTFQ